MGTIRSTPPTEIAFDSRTSKREKVQNKSVLCIRYSTKSSIKAQQNMDKNRSSTSKSNQAKQPKQNNLKNQPQALKQPAQPQILNKDLFQRINYTYQAAIFLQNIGVDAGPSSPISKRDGDVHVVMDRKGKRRAVERKGHQEAFKKLARMSMRETRTMVVHNQLKL